MKNKISKSVGNGLNYEAQKELLNYGVIPILKNRFPNVKFFFPPAQGNNIVYISLITVANKNRAHVKEIKLFLINDFLLNIDEGSDKHGTAANYVITINLSEVSLESIDLIRGRSQKILEEAIAKEERKKIKNEKNIIANEEIKIENHLDVTPIENSKPSLKVLGQKRRSVTMALNSLLDFYGLTEENRFSFSVSIDEKDQTLHCKTELIAEQANLLLSWMLVRNDNGIIVLWDGGNDVSFDMSKMNDFYSKKESNVHFVPPIMESVDIVEVERILKYLTVGTVPIVRKIKSGIFEIIYTKKATVSRVFSLLKEMGWNVEIKDGKLICYVGLNIPKIKKEKVKPNVTLIEKSQEKEIIPDLLPSVNTISSTHNLSFAENKGEAIVELRDLFENKHLFSKLSKPTQEKVVNKLRDIAKEQNTEAYANSLLDFWK